ncbi:MAG: hypothetical protein AAF441_03250 [Pseudomonadota bacterium]
MNLSVDFAPLLPVELLAVLGVLALAILGFGIIRRARGAFLRLLATAAVFLALLNPIARDEVRNILPDVAVVLTDHSQSQTIDGRDVRTQAATDQLKETLKGARDLEVKYVSVRPNPVPEDEGTVLFKSLNEALADVPPERFAGAVIVTDGQVHDVPESLKPQGYDGPVQALITGRRQERDRRIVIEEAPKFGIVGQTLSIRFRIEDYNISASDAEVTVSRGGREVQRRRFPIGPSIEIEISVDHGGTNITELAVSPAEGELTEINNRVVVLTDGVRDRLRVLLVSGEPHAGERTWRNLLKSDAAVDLVHFTILRPPEKQDATPINELSLIAFPTRELFSQKLNDFDLIIFDRYQRRGVLPLIYLANVSKYVEEGGAVLTAAGPAFASQLSLYRTPLSSVLPSIPTGEVITQPFHPRITKSGERHPVTRGLEGGGQEPPDWGRWFRLIDVDPKQGDIVMSGPFEKPLMILDRIGKGRVAQLLSDHAWLWARGYEGGGPQAEMLRRLAHWLMKEPDLEEEALLGSHKGRTLTIERRTMAQTASPVTVTTPSGKTEELELKQEVPGVWRARMEVSEVGVHRLKDDQLSSVAAVGSADPKELTEIIASENKLAGLLADSGGRGHWISEATGNAIALPSVRRIEPGRRMAGQGWMGLKRNGAYRVESLRELPLFSHLLALAALLFLLAFAWYREGH